MREGDRILAVNGEGVEGLVHQEVVDRIRAGGNQVTLLIIDPEGDKFYSSVRPGRIVEHCEGSSSKTFLSGHPLPSVGGAGSLYAHCHVGFGKADLPTGDALIWLRAPGVVRLTPAGFPDGAVPAPVLRRWALSVGHSRHPRIPSQQAAGKQHARRHTPPLPPRYGAGRVRTPAADYHRRAGGLHHAGNSP